MGARSLRPSWKPNQNWHGEQYAGSPETWIRSANVDVAFPSLLDLTLTEAFLHKNMKLRQDHRSKDHLNPGIRTGQKVFAPILV